MVFDDTRKLSVAAKITTAPICRVAATTTGVIEFGRMSLV